MRILLIGNFIPPYEEENLHNITLLTLLRQEGHECCVMNIDDTPQDQLPETTHNTGVVFIRNYLDFIVKLFRFGLKNDVIHFLTKGYTRPGLMKMVTAVFFGKILLKKVVITLHSELFSIFGQMRSRMGGQQLLNLSFKMANKIICGDTHTFEVASLHYSNKNRFVMLPSFFQVPDDANISSDFLSSLENNNKIIVFSSVSNPALIFDILDELLNNYIDSETVIAVSSDEETTKYLYKKLDESNNQLKDAIIFIPQANADMLSMAYARSDLIVRALSCDCKPLFHDIAVIVKKPQHSAKFLFFPDSLVFIKEGKSVDLIAYSIYKLLKDRSEKFSPKQEEYYEKIRDIYLK